MHIKVKCPDYEYGQITQNIGVGPLPPVGGVVSQAFTDLVLCCDSYQPLHDCFSGVRVHHCPLKDDLTPFSSEIEKMMYNTVLRCVDSIRKGGRVLFTCHAGHNRSALLACLTAHNSGYSLIDFMNKVKSVRGPLALENPMFVQYLYNQM